MKKGLLAALVLLCGALGLAHAEYAILITNLGQRPEAPPSSGAGGAGGAGGGMGVPRPPTGGGGTSGSGRNRNPQISGRGNNPGGRMPGYGGQGGTTKGGGGNEDPLSDEPEAIYVTTIIEFDPMNPIPATFKKNLATFEEAAGELAIKHRWGHSWLASIKALPKVHKLEVGASVPISSFDGTRMPSVLRRFLNQHDEVFKTPNPSPERVVELAKWALQHGLLDKFVETMDRVDDRSLPAVAAYQDVKSRLKENLAKPPETNRLQLAGVFVANQSSPHFFVYYKPELFDIASQANIQSKVTKLENSFKAYYYWFALQGQKLPMPKEQLTVVLATTRDEFNMLSRALNSSAPVADGFFCRRDDITVIAKDPLEAAYDQLSRKSESLLSSTNGYKKGDILLGKTHESGMPLNADQFDKANAHMWTLMLKAMEDDSENASITHAVARQLAYATGQLSRNVAAPEWVQFGFGSFFETPSGSPWTSYAAPNGPFVLAWKDMLPEKKHEMRMEATPLETLRKVVTNSYFLDRGVTQDEKDALLHRARATSWALTYYLMETNLTGLQAFYRELARQPRDVELDGELVWTCFTRALAPDEAKQKELATRWFNYMSGLRCDTADLYKKAEDLKAEVHKLPPPPAPGSNGAGGSGKMGGGSG